MLIIGETIGRWGPGDTWELSVVSTQFFCKPKTALERNLFIKITIKKLKIENKYIYKEREKNLLLV